MERIVVAIDGSAASADALLWAMRESVYRGAPVVGVMTWGWLDQHHPGGGTDFQPEYAAADAATALDAFVEEAIGEDAARVRTQVINDLPAAGLLEFTDDADLLVLGARGLGGFKGLLLGSVSQACLHHATCPVAIVRQTSQFGRNDPERIVVGIDGSPTSSAALTWALDEARARGATLEVVYAWSVPYPMGYSYGAVVSTTADEDATRQVVEDAIRRSDTHGLVRPVEQVVVPDAPSAGLLEISKGADLLVVGSRGVGGFRGMLLGSVSHQVAQHAECPVVVIPAGR